MYPLYKSDGYRQLITLKCSGQMTKDDLRGWWFKRSEKVKKLLNLKWYTLCFTFDTVNYSDGSPGCDLKFDGYEEIYFNSYDDLVCAYDSKIMQDGFDEIKNFESNNQIICNAVWAEAFAVKMKGITSPPKQKGCYRIFGGCIKKDDMSYEDLKKWYHGHAAKVIDKNGKMIIPEIIGYIHNFTLNNSPLGKPFVNAYCNNWWASFEDMKKTFSGNIWQGQLIHREEHIDDEDKSLFIGALAQEYIIDL